MKVEHADDKLREIESTPNAGLGCFTPAVVKGFRKRMQLVRAATDIRDLYAYKGNRLEKLSGDRKNQYSMVLTGNWRLVIEVDQSSSPARIIILEIVDYH